MALEEINKRFLYKSDSSFDNWRGLIPSGDKLIGDCEEYKDKYSLEYQKRAEARALINSLEG